jgi:hypothetical protein
MGRFSEVGIAVFTPPDATDIADSQGYPTTNTPHRAIAPPIPSDKDGLSLVNTVEELLGDPHVQTFYPAHQACPFQRAAVHPLTATRT